MHDVCAAMAASPMDYNRSHKVLTDEIPSVGHTNLLFARDGAKWNDVTAKWKVGYGGWTWNAKSPATITSSRSRATSALTRTA